MDLQLYNSLTRTKERFVPLTRGNVGIYVCGPTVYSDSHVGHGKSYVSFDVIVRFLEFIGNRVLYVQNITDVGHLLESGEDRILRQSKIEKVHPMQIVETFTRSYFEDMDALNVRRPDISPRASGHITEQIEIVRELLAKGFAYEVNGSIYFEVRKFKEYGRLSGRNLDEAREGTRVAVREEKKNTEDFALWKRADPEHILRWPSPWGEGFPGWHIECSAMSMKYLGETFDIHGGGLDNQFPHHECEIAQSESATGKTFARYWLHNNLVTVDGQKMSKSLGNFVTLKDAFRQCDPIAVRFFILQSHYRSPLDFRAESIRAAMVGWEKIAATVRKVDADFESREAAGSFGSFDVQPEIAKYRGEFLEAMSDDFSTPKAIAVLFNAVSAVNDWSGGPKPLTRDSHLGVKALFQDLAGTVLGILPHAKDGIAADGGPPTDDLMQVIIDIRNLARDRKQWELSDKIRDLLKAKGVSLEDTKERTTWKKIPE
ncbi:MAG TPA: cysteine--tRNA ligase [Bacteroidota bacterium]|nr:cysteine--tRNA ligase [Bacteroidota bacterium]